MQVLFLNKAEKYQGGAEIYWQEIASGLSEQEINVSRASFQINTSGTRRWLNAFKSVQDRHQLTEILALIDDFHPDIIHVNKQLFFSSRVMFYLKTLHIPIVLTVHDYYTTPFPVSIKSIIKNRLFPIRKMADRFIIPSKHFFDKLEHQAIPNIHYIPPFIETNKWPYNHQYLASGKDLLYVGRLEKLKGVFVLLEAMKKLVLHFPLLGLTIVGDGREKAHLLEQIKRLKLEAHVKLVGHKNQAELLEYYHRAAMLVVPSVKNELFGLVGLEAQASGLPVIASDLAGIREWCLHGKTGMTFKANDATMLALQIKNLLEQPKLREKIRRNAFGFVKRHFSKEIAMQKLIQLYKTVLHEAEPKTT